MLAVGVKGGCDDARAEVPCRSTGVGVPPGPREHPVWKGPLKRCSRNRRAEGAEKGLRAGGPSGPTRLMLAIPEALT